MPSLMVCNYLRKLYKQRLPRRESQTNIARNIPVRHTVSSSGAFGINILTSSLAVLLAIFPWITLVFTSALIIVLFMAARRRVWLETSSQIPMSEEEKMGIKT